MHRSDCFSLGKYFLYSAYIYIYIYFGAERRYVNLSGLMLSCVWDRTLHLIPILHSSCIFTVVVTVLLGVFLALPVTMITMGKLTR